MCVPQNINLTERTKMFYNALGHHLECFPGQIFVRFFFFLFFLFIYFFFFFFFYFFFFYDTYGIYKDGILLKNCYHNLTGSAVAQW